MLALLFVFVNICSLAKTQVSDVGCGTTKYCWKWPGGCTLTDPNCRFVSWNESTTSGDYYFEMRSNEGTGRYHAFGIGIGQQMPDADIYVCRDNGLLFGSTTARASPPVETTTDGITQLSAAIINGYLQCTFTRVRSITRPISGSQTHTFDLVDNVYHILMAVGVSSGNVISYHSGSRTVSTESFNFSAPLPTPPVQTSTPTSSATSSASQFNATATSTELQTNSTPWSTNSTTAMDSTTWISNSTTTPAPANSTESQTNVTPWSINSTTAMENNATAIPPWTISSTTWASNTSFTVSPTTSVAAQTDSTPWTATTASTSGGGNLLVTRSGCGTTKTCYSYTDNCDLLNPACVLITWRKDGNFFQFEMSGSAGSGAHYVALAFAENKIMQNADTYICNGQTLTSAVITRRFREPNYLSLEGGVALVRATTVNGIAQCIFRRPATVVKTTTSSAQTFDLNTNQYYLLIASGQTNGPRIRQHILRTVKQEKVNFAASPGSGVGNLVSTPLLLLWLAGMTVFVQFKIASQL